MSVLSGICECGHGVDRHGFIGSGYALAGSCFAQIDTRHVTTGGDGLTPCPCQRFSPVVPSGNVPAGLYREQETR